jgi:hypothetical protein
LRLGIDPDKAEVGVAVEVVATVFGKLRLALSLVK